MRFYRARFHTHRLRDECRIWCSFPSCLEWIRARLWGTEPWRRRGHSPALWWCPYSRLSCQQPGRSSPLQQHQQQRWKRARTMERKCYGKRWIYNSNVASTNLQKYNKLSITEINTKDRIKWRGNWKNVYSFMANFTIKTLMRFETSWQLVSLDTFKRYTTCVCSSDLHGFSSSGGRCAITTKYHVRQWSVHGLKTKHENNKSKQKFWVAEFKSKGISVHNTPAVKII